MVYFTVIAHVTEPGAMPFSSARPAKKSSFDPDSNRKKKACICGLGPAKSEPGRPTEGGNDPAVAAVGSVARWAGFESLLGDRPSRWPRPFASP
jgi:hypothetical protein